MPGTQRNGVDSAIELLAALARRGGSGWSAELALELDIPRASFHRITRMLASFGVLTCTRGKVSVGPIAKGLIAAMAKTAEEQDSKRERVLGEAVRPVVAHGMPLASTPPALSRPVVSAPRKRFRIGFSNGAMDNPWQVALVHSVEFAASRLQSMLEHVEIVHANGDPLKQIDDIERLAASGVDGILVSALMPRELFALASRVTNSGLPLVFVERGGSSGLECTSFVTSDNSAIGVLTAQWLVETLKGKGSILMLYGHADAELTQNRQVSARAVFDRHPSIRVIDTDATRFRRDLAYGTVADAIARHGEEISGVWCDSGLNSVGSIEAFLDAGFEAGRIPPHTGGDLNLSYKLAVGHGIPMASVDYPPAMGIRAFETLIAAIRGAWVPRHVNISSRFVTSKRAAVGPIPPGLCAEDRVRWDMPDNLVFGAGLGSAYNPAAFRVSYPGNSHNRSAAVPGLIR